MPDCYTSRNGTIHGHTRCGRAYGFRRATDEEIELARTGHAGYYLCRRCAPNALFQAGTRIPRRRHADTPEAVTEDFVLRHRQFERGVRAALGVIDQYMDACKVGKKDDLLLVAAALADRVLDLIDPTRAGSIHGSESYKEAQKEASGG